MSTIIGEEIFLIGTRLKEERERIGLSQETLGARIGTTGRTIKKYEGNETSPRATELAQMHGLGADILYIVTGVRIPLGVAQARASYTPAARLGDFVAGLTLDEEDAALLQAMAGRLSR